MSYENTTIEEIYNLFIEAFGQEFNNSLKLLPKSFIRLLSKILAGIFIILYKLNGWFFLQIFVSTASFKEVTVLGRRIRPLVEWGMLVGVGAPGSATEWRGTAVVSVISPGNTLLSGTQLRSSLTEKIYITENTVFLAGETVSVNIFCTESGTAGNLDAGDEVEFVNPVGTVKKSAFIESVISMASDEETEGTYRQRVQNRFKMQPQGGSLIDYRKWASEVPGVYKTYIYTDPDSPAGVLIYVSADISVYPDRIPPASVLIAVGDACTYNPETGEQDRKPLGAVLDPAGNGSYSNIKPVTVTGFDVYVTGVPVDVDIADFANQAKTNIELYFLNREPFVRGLSVDNVILDKITKVNVIGILNEIAISKKIDFSAVDIKTDDASIGDPGYVLGFGELSKLDNFYINGAAF